MKALFFTYLVLFFIFLNVSGCSQPQPEDELMDLVSLNPCDEDPKANECLIDISVCDDTSDLPECANFDPCADDPEVPECKTLEPCESNSDEC